VVDDRDLVVLWNLGHVSQGGWPYTACATSFRVGAARGCLPVTVRGCVVDSGVVEKVPFYRSCLVTFLAGHPALPAKGWDGPGGHGWACSRSSIYGCLDMHGWCRR
jgi:hypothetical protein